MKALYSLQRWIVTAVIFLFPIIFLPLTQEFYITHKFYLVLWGSLLLLALVGAEIFVSKKIRIVSTPFGRIIAAFILALGLSVFFSSPNKVQALYRLPTGFLAFGASALLYYLIVYSGTAGSKKLSMYKPLALGAIVSAVVAMLFFFNPFSGVSLPPEWTFLKAQRFSLLGNPLDTLLFFGFILAVQGSMLVDQIRKSSGKIGILTPLSALAAAGALGVTAYLVFGPQAAQQGAAQQGGIQLPPFSVSWFAAIETLKNIQTAFIGFGLDNFDSVFTLVKPVIYNASDVWQVNFSLSRSALLQIWTEAGLLGLITFLLISVNVVRELHGLHIHNDPKKWVYIVSGIYLLAAIVLFPPSFIIYALFFIFLAALALKSISYDQDAVDDVQLKNAAPIYAGLAAIMLIAAGAAAYFTGQAYRAQYHFKQSIDAISQNDGRAVYSNLQQAIRLNPYIERYRAQFSQINLLLANNLAQREEVSDEDRQAIAQFIQQAIAEAKTLVQLNPGRASNWNNLAVIYRNVIGVAEGADAWTVATYNEAIRRDPNNPQLRLNLGGVYYAAQAYDSAVANFERAVVLKPDWANAHYNLAWAYYQTGNFSASVAQMQNVLQLISPDSEDYTLAQENLELFRQELDAEATGSGALEAPESATDQGPLELPATPEARLSPPLELPEGTGPDITPADGADTNDKAPADDGASDESTAGDAESSPTPAP